jgi:hypothetical protein
MHGTIYGYHLRLPIKTQTEPLIKILIPINRMIPFYLMHNRIYRLAKIEFASFVEASLSRGSLHIVRRPLKFDVPILVCENSREPTARARRNHIRFRKRYSSIK